MSTTIAEQTHAGPFVERVRLLWERAWRGELCPHTQERAAWSAETLQACRALPRKIQIARLLDTVCERMPVFVAPGELVVGCRTVGGYPEIDDAIARAAAEPGYMIADHATVVTKGLAAIVARCERALGGLDEARPGDTERVDTLRSMAMACRAVIRLAERHADECARLAAEEPSAARRAELEELARICRKVPARPAETFHEAVQSMWLAHLGVFLECDNCGFALGRIDQYLDPFYRSDLAAGRIDPERAVEILECLWVKVYENVRGDIMHAQTATIGGLTPDGTDGTNDLTRLVLRAAREMATMGPSVALRVHAGTPDDVIAYSLETLRMGRYMPQFYSDDRMVSAIAGTGIPIEDARDYGIIGCHEPTICGKAYSRPASWPGYFPIPRALERALGNGCMLDTGAREGIATGDPSSWASFDDAWSAFAVQIGGMVREKVIEANRGEQVKKTLMPRPFLSALIAGCVDSGRDFTEGGALYNTSGFQAFGIGTAADSLVALRRLCFGDRRMPVSALVDTLRADWEGQEDLRLHVRNTFPHFGNGEEEADAMAARIVSLLEGEIGRHTNARGGPFLLGLWSFTSHVWHGKNLAATPDGRRRGEPLSHSMGPTVGCGKAGPTGIIRSAARIDTSRMANGGSLLIEVQPSLLTGAGSLAAIAALVRSYFAMGGIQLQLSAVSAEMLEAAVKSPERFGHLVVRVAGYCDYFVRLARYPELQAYVIAREKHARMGA